MTRIARALTTLVATSTVAALLIPGVAAAETRVVVDDRRDAARLEFTEDDELRITPDPGERSADIVRQTTSYGARLLTVTVRFRELERDGRGPMLLGQIATDAGRQGFEVTVRRGEGRFRWEGAADPSQAPCDRSEVAVEVLAERPAVRLAIPTTACLDDAPWVRVSTIAARIVRLRADEPDHFRYWLDGALTRGPIKLRQPFGGMGPKVRRG